MKLNLKKLLLLSALLPTAAWSQNVDRSKYPDYSDKVNPDPSLMQPRKMRGKAASVTGLPDYVNNAETRYFRPCSTRTVALVARPHASATCFRMS